MVQHLKRCSSNITFLEAIADTEGLLMEILLRLPARPLVRFKCVSKNWLSLISDPKFCHLHTLRNPKPSISAVVGNRSLDFGIIPLGPTSYCGWNPLNRIPHGDDEEIAIIQSCNGLFFCHPQTAVMWAVGASYPAVPPTKKPIYYVLNPTTNHFSTLIPPAAAAATTEKPRVFGYGLAFDPSKSSPHNKVVILWAINEDRDSSQYYHIEIYSSETRSWRLLASSFTTQFQVDYTNGVSCNGALHWVGMDNVMAYYHVDEERVGFVDSPPLPHEKRFPQFRNTCFHENGGRLHLIHIYNCSTKFEVLEMGRDYSGWFVKYNVDLDPLCTAYSWFDDPAILFLHRVENEDKHLQIYEEGEGGSSCLLLHTPGKVISYNLKTNTFKYLDITPLAGYDDSLTRVGSMNFLYMETLACV